MAQQHEKRLTNDFFREFYLDQHWQPRVWLGPSDPSSGKRVIRDFVTKLLVGYKVKGERPTGSKKVRLKIFAAQAEFGNVDILEADWNDDYMTEIEQAPNGPFMDQADATSQGINELADHEESTTEIMARLRKVN